jgi:hypothetical protein
MELMQFSLTKTMQVTVGYSLIYDSCQEARELLFKTGAWVYSGISQIKLISLNMGPPGTP